MFQPDVSLSDAQVAIFSHLYKKRLRVFLFGFIGVMAFWLKASYQPLKNWYSFRFEYLEKIVTADFAESANTVISLLLLIIAAFLSFFIYTFFKNILPLYKDIQQRVGLYIPLEITKKSIPYHGRCFLFLDNLKIPFIEVDYATYLHYQVGDKINVLVGKYSKIHIDDYLNMRLL